MSYVIVNQAVNLYKQGKKRDACNLLIDLLRKDPKNESAWYGLAICLDETHRKEYCLEKVLEINPDHEKAKHSLERLGEENNLLNDLTAGTDIDPTVTTKEQIPVSTTGSVPNSKKCPFCAETIKAEAFVCRFCGRDLQPVYQQNVAHSPKKQSLSGGDIFIAFLLPIVGLIVAVYYLLKSEGRERGFTLIVVSIIAWAVWWVICSFSGLFA